MAWLFPRRAAPPGPDRLDAVLAEQVLAGEALSQAASAAAAEAEDTVARAGRVTERADARIRRQEMRRTERQRRAASDPAYAIAAGVLSRFGPVDEDSEYRESDA